MRRLTHKPLACAVSCLTKQAGVAQCGCSKVGFLLGLAWLLLLPACGATSQERLLYQTSGIQVGIVTDLSTNEHAMPPVRNKHPADLTPKEIRSLLGSLEVSGWSGAIVGLFNAPQPRALFTWGELVELAEPLAAAFHEVTPRERVFFAVQNPAASYESDRTSGSLFFRDEYLHVVLTDHYGFLQADPGGGEKRDPRDTKGMRLWVAGPAKPATVSKGKEPHWNVFEKVHISLNPAEAGSTRSQVGHPGAEQPAMRSDASSMNETETVNDLRLRIRELTDANLELRTQMKEQSATIEKLQAEFEGLRNEKRPGTSKPSAPKPSRKLTLP